MIAEPIWSLDSVPYNLSLYKVIENILKSQ